MRHTVADIVGRDVGVGDRIAAAFRTSTNAYMRVGRVTGFSERVDVYMGGRKETLMVEWDDGGPTQIFVHHQRFARISD